MLAFSALLLAFRSFPRFSVCFYRKLKQSGLKLARILNKTIVYIYTWDLDKNKHAPIPNSFPSFASLYDYVCCAHSSSSRTHLFINEFVFIFGHFLAKVQIGITIFSNNIFIARTECCFVYERRNWSRERETGFQIWALVCFILSRLLASNFKTNKIWNAILFFFSTFIKQMCGFF